MAQKHLEQVLTTAGLTEAQIKALAELKDDVADFKPDDYVAPITTGVETRIKNDPKFYEGLNKDSIPKEFLKKLEAEQYGAGAAQVRHHLIKNLALDPKKFEGDELKPLDKFLAAVQVELANNKGLDKDLQQKLVEANTKLAQMESELPNVEKKHQEAAEQRINNAMFDMQVLANLGTVEGLKVSAALISDKIAGAVKAKYAFELVNGLVELRQKDKPTLQPMSADGKKILTLKDVVAALADEYGAIDPDWKKKQTKTGGGTTTVDVEPQGGKGGFKVSPHVKGKIDAQIEKEKA